MKGTIVGAGMILLFAGIMVLPTSLQVTKTPENHLLAEREFLVFPNWIASAQFNESEEMVIYFSRPNTEGVPDGDEVLAVMFVDIVDPHGGNTTFNISFTERSFGRAVDHNDGGLLVKSPQYTEIGDIGGKTQYTGEYTVRVYTYRGLVPYYYPNSSTMRRLEISKTTERIEYPYIAALPVSVSLAAVGLVLTVWGARSPKRRARSRKA
jgi:hypothetical protein